MRSSLFYTLLSLSITKFVFATACTHDNCLNALVNHPASASSFCTPYLATTQTAITGIPTFLSNCKSSTSRLSSACSCIFTSTSPSSSSSTTSPTSTQPSCTTSSTTITTTIISNTACPSTRAASTITSVSTSISISTVTVTTTVGPSCHPQIVGGDFTSSSQNINAFTVTQIPPNSIFTEVLSPSQEQFLAVTDGTTQFLFLNYVLAPFPSTLSYSIAQSIGIICAPYTSLTLSATINAGFEDGAVTFCINPTTCSTPQSVAPTNGKFVQYSATFSVATGADVTASMSLAVNGFVPLYVAGIGNFQLTPS